MSDYKEGTIVRTERGNILRRANGGWDLLLKSTAYTMYWEELEDSEVIWEPDVLEGLLAGSIIQDSDDLNVVAVKTPRNGWFITAETRSGYTDEKVKDYFVGGIEVVKEVR